MPVSALVLTLAARRSDALVRADLGAIDGVELGRANGNRLPMTLDHDEPLAHQRALDALARVDGVVFVDLVSHDFEDVVVTPPAIVEPRRRGASHGTP